MFIKPGEINDLNLMFFYFILERLLCLYLFFYDEKKRISPRHTARDNHVVYIKEDVYSFLFVIEWKNVR